MDKKIIIETAQYITPFLGERVSGDLPILHEDDSYVYAVLVDGMGHGEQANRMSNYIGDRLRSCWSSNPVHIISDLNNSIDKSVGAAIGVLVISKSKLYYSYSGLGNIRCKIIGSDNTSNLTSTDGILGMRYRSSSIHQGSVMPGDIILLYSDGVNGLDNVKNWNRYAALKCRTIVRRIVNEYGTDLDDSSCIAIRINYFD